MLNEYLKSIGGTANKNRAVGGYFFSKEKASNDPNRSLFSIIAFMEGIPTQMINTRQAARGGIVYVVVYVHLPRFWYSWPYRGTASSSPSNSTTSGRLSSQLKPRCTQARALSPMGSCTPARTSASRRW